MSNAMNSGVGSEFTRIGGADLKPIAVVAQCLDNQWIRRDLLRHMLTKRLSFQDESIHERRLRDARAEYLRAVLNAEQVIVNRAYFYNNPVVYQDFLNPTPARETFKNLLNTHVLVPYLLNELSPGQPPGAFTTDDAGWSAWCAVLLEANPQCVRLSWDDEENQQYLETHMYGSFRRFVGSLGFFDREGLARDLQLDRAAAEALLRQLKAATTWAMNEERIVRETFYETFVVVDGTKPALGYFDPDKPFAAELKQLADLKYATTLPDVLNRFPLTPADALHRTALQEERLIRLDQPTTSPASLIEPLLRRLAFDLVQQPLNISLTGLELSHVWAARQTDEWQRYIAALRGLVAHPDEFEDRAQAVYNGYVELAGALARQVGERRAASGPSWAPVIKVVIEVLGATLFIVYASDPIVQVVGEVAERVAGTASTAIVRFVVASHDRRVSRNEMSTGVEIMRVKLAHTRNDWRELLARLKDRGLPIRYLDSEDAVEDSGMDSSADQREDT